MMWATSSSRHLVVNRQLFEPADEGGRGERGRANQLDGTQSRQKVSVEAVDLHPSERCAEAEVHAGTEAEMAVRFTADVETLRVLEGLGIAIARGKDQGDRFAGCDGNTPKYGVPGSGPHEDLDRSGPTDHLLDGSQHQGRVVA